MATKDFKVDVEKAVGHRYEPETVVCNQRDFLIYALGVGVKEDELKYLYELNKDFAPLPTYPLVLMLRKDDYNVNLFKDRANGKGNLPGMPPFDPNKIVHGEQSLEVIRPFPKEGGEFQAHKTCTGVFDKGSGMVIETTLDLYSGKTHYCRMISKSFVRGYGGWNGPKGPKATTYTPPSRAPDAVELFATQINQAILYRLSGDYNPLHIDPDLAPKVGFPKPILHGLSTYGACGHAVIKACANNDPSRFKSIEARFASPVFPGETVEILMWKQPLDATQEAVIFLAKVKDRVVVNNGYCVLHKSPSKL
ncbi:HotDog domain-containing protein [Sporodiniella umbellata]|nr:HotDog domain-containing protein [Sporodiniella umbellata]